MSQKLSICCALLPSPKVVLFDEPMIGLDPHAIKELRSIFADMSHAGASLLISTHMIDSIENIWDRTLIMKQSRLLADIERRQLEQNGDKLEDVFFGLTEAVPTAATER